MDTSVTDLVEALQGILRRIDSAGDEPRVDLNDIWAAAGKPKGRSPRQWRRSTLGQAAVDSLRRPAGSRARGDLPRYRRPQGPRPGRRRGRGGLRGHARPRGRRGRPGRAGSSTTSPTSAGSSTRRRGGRPRPSWSGNSIACRSTPSTGCARASSTPGPAPTPGRATPGCPAHPRGAPRTTRARTADRGSRSSSPRPARTAGSATYAGGVDGGGRAGRRDASARRSSTTGAASPRA